MTSREPWQGQRIGNLREQIVLQHFTTITNEYNEQIQVWQDIATVYARVEPVKGGEGIGAGQLQAYDEHHVHIRHRSDVGPTWRVQHRGRTLEILSVLNLDERRRFLTLECRGVA